MLEIRNTLTGRDEPFVPLEEGKVKMYVCGPTVYGFLHIGNGRTFMVWDVARRYLQYRGYEVTYVQNFTDIDDKIINRAKDEGVTADVIAERYTRAYFEDMEALGVLPADHYPKATETVAEMIDHIQGLIAKGMAYEVEGDVYFRVRQFPDYGKLSGHTPEQLRSGARVEVDERKEDSVDFALWKAAKPGEPAWESPWGLGRPGWHIECSAMVRRILGETIDIHAGGKDLQFPHHENEIAQSEGLTGQLFVKYWMHTGFLNLESEKMSKSLGNIKNIRDVVAAYGQQAVRYFMLQTDYKKDLDFTDEAVRGSWEGFKRLRKTLAAWDGNHAAAGHEEIQRMVVEAREAFIGAMDRDFNTASAIAHFNETANRLRKLAHERPELVDGFGALVAELKQEASVLGLELTHEEEPQAQLGDERTGELLQLLVDIRKDAKANKNWALADQIRNRLKDMGINLLDHKDGSTTWEVADKALV